MIEEDLDRLYAALQRLEAGVGGRRRLSQCTGKDPWPARGVYIVFEPGETRPGTGQLRVVRVGTHAVSGPSRTKLWTRLRTHRGAIRPNSRPGNHRGSIFRLHVGKALARRNPALYVPSWGEGQSAPAEVRENERALEAAVSKHIGAMTLLWLAVDDASGPQSDRAFLERNLVGLLAQACELPSDDWLGNYSAEERIRKSGLWNLNHLKHSYTPEFLDILEEYVAVTVGDKAKPGKSIAPMNRNGRE